MGGHKRKHDGDESSESDGEKKVRNRSDTKERERQWQTVKSSDDDSDSSSSDSSSSDSEASSRSNRRSDRKRKEKDSKHDRHKESKHKKHKKDKDKKHKKEHKKDRKHKKDKKNHNDRHSKSFSSRSVNQNQFGKYGIIREDNFFHKQREFEAYMAEVKGLPGVMSEGKREIMQHFKTFMEDYNTATMPHEKYYNYEQWEMREYQRGKADEMRRAMADADDGAGLMPLNDEEQRRRELKRQKDEAERQEFLALKNKMAANKDIQGDMRRQAQLNTELQLAFKRGDTATVKRLERLLAPDEDKVAVKHPWK